MESSGLVDQREVVPEEDTDDSIRRFQIQLNVTGTESGWTTSRASSEESLCEWALVAFEEYPNAIAAEALELLLSHGYMLGWRQVWWWCLAELLISQLGLRGFLGR